MIDWQKAWNHEKRLQRPWRETPLFRAVAGKSGDPRQLLLIDATCGLGHDTLLFLYWGFTVKACERNPAVFALLQQESQRLQASVQERLSLFAGDARHFLQSPELELELDLTPKVVYLDPMYGEHQPTKTRSKQAIEWLRETAGPDSDATDLFDQALKLKGLKRLVVKRPIKAAPLVETIAPALTQKGHSTRYDIYLP